MTTTKITTVAIKSSDSNGSANLQYNQQTLVQSGTLILRWAGGSVQFSTVAEFNTFMSELAVPMLNTINSVSGTGVGYISASVGVAGSDKVTN